MNNQSLKYVFHYHQGHIMRAFVFIIMFLLLCSILHAQEQVNSEKMILTRERTDRINEFSENFKHVEDSLWFVGKEYKFLNNDSKGTPFFYDEVKFHGTLIFNGKKYRDLTLFYDIVKDALVMHHSSDRLGFVFIHLNKDWVQEFTLERENLFFRFIPDTYFDKLKTNLPGGYFEVVYENQLVLLYKGSKRISFETFDNNYFRYSFSQKTYLVKNNNAFDVTKKVDFLNAFGEHKKQIKSFLRHSNIIYKNASRAQLISLMQYCETLT